MNTIVDVNATFNISGNIKPLYIRIEDLNHELHTCKIKNIKSIKDERYSGINSILFICNIDINNLEQKIEIRYYIESHKWALIK